MKTYLFYSLIFLLITLWACDKPAPTELINENNTSENIEVEIIGKELDNEYYANGFDTTGVTEDLRDYINIVSVSGIKLTKDGRTVNISVAQAILVDQTKPVYSLAGQLIGYNTITPGIIYFNLHPARLTNLIVRYRENGVLVDTTLGKKYELFNLFGRLIGDPFTFPYNSVVRFLYKPILMFGQDISFDIPTPKEVTGNVKLNKLQEQQKFNAELTWNKENSDNFSIIVGGAFLNSQLIFPFYRIKTADDGSLIIPASLLENIPRNLFNKLSISFIRKYKNFQETSIGKLYVSSQSIHTIIIDLP